MPVFSKKTDKTKQTIPSLPPPPVQAPRTYPIPHRHELIFHCQLAHGSSTREIKDFASVKDLYSKIADSFEIEKEEIIFCTLNTHRVDMDCLLGGQIGLEDFIFAHVKGQLKEVSVTKTKEALGLTITDNGSGYPFIKRIKEGSTIAAIPNILVGDHVQAINRQNLVGCRHYEVARLLKELPQSTTFIMKLIEPKKAFEAIAPRKSRPVSKIMEEKPAELEKAVNKDEGRATLRLKKSGEAVVEKVSSWEELAINKIDNLLESFLGIRDSELAQALVDASKDETSVAGFTTAVNDSLGEFQFPDEFILNVWSAIDTSKSSPQS